MARTAFAIIVALSLGVAIAAVPSHAFIVYDGYSAANCGGTHVCLYFVSSLFSFLATRIVANLFFLSLSLLQSIPFATTPLLSPLSSLPSPRLPRPTDLDQVLRRRYLRRRRFRWKQHQADLHVDQAFEFGVER